MATSTGFRAFRPGLATRHGSPARRGIGMRARRLRSLLPRLTSFANAPFFETVSYTALCTDFIPRSPPRSPATRVICEWSLVLLTGFGDDPALERRGPVSKTVGRGFEPVHACSRLSHQ